MDKFEPNAVNDGSTTPQSEDRTFTQDELNAIIGKRLSEEKTRLEASLAEKEKEFAQREIRLAGKEMLTEKGLPLELLDALNCADKNTLEKSVSIIGDIIETIKSERLPFKITGAMPVEGAGRDIRELHDEYRHESVRRAMGLTQN